MNPVKQIKSHRRFSFKIPTLRLTLLGAWHSATGITYNQYFHRNADTFLRFFSLADEDLALFPLKAEFRSAKNKNIFIHILNFKFKTAPLLKKQL